MNKKEKRNLQGIANKSMMRLLSSVLFTMMLLIAMTLVFQANTQRVRALEPVGNWVDSANRVGAYESGTGSEEDPYMIATGAQLARMAYLSKSSVNDKYYELSNDIELGYHYWTAIGI